MHRLTLSCFGDALAKKNKWRDVADITAGHFSIIYWCEVGVQILSLRLFLAKILPILYFSVERYIVAGNSISFNYETARKPSRVEGKDNGVSV